MSGTLQPSPMLEASELIRVNVDAMQLGDLEDHAKHVLDTIATPAAVIAGTVTTAAMITDISPFLKWTMALIAGGGIAGLVQASTVAVRAKSSIATAGTANPIFSTFDSIITILSCLKWTDKYATRSRMTGSS